MEDEKVPEQKPGEDDQLAGLLKNRDAILAEKKALQDRLSAAETEREALKGKLAQYEPKVTEAEGLKAQLAEAQQAAEALRERTRMSQLSLALQVAGVRDPDYARIVRDAVKFDNDDRPEGLDEYLTALRESKPWLFADAEKKGTVNFPGKAGTTGRSTITREELRNMSSAEYAAHRKEILAAKIT